MAWTAFAKAVRDFKPAEDQGTTGRYVAFRQFASLTIRRAIGDAIKQSAFHTGKAKK